MLKILDHGTIYLVVDALDECDSGLSELLNLITDNEFTPQFRVKWLITSRNRGDIERQLRLKNLCLGVSLELNSCVSHAMDSFVNIKVQGLAREEEYNTELKEEVSRYLKDNAQGTFLWVALACKMLKGVPTCDIRSTLEEFPPGLGPIYERMMKQIGCLKHVKNCKCIIVPAILAHRPLHLKELGAIADLSTELWEDLSSFKGLVQLCGSFSNRSRRHSLSCSSIRKGFLYHRQWLKHHLLKSSRGTRKDCMSAFRPYVKSFARGYL